VGRQPSGSRIFDYHCSGTANAIGRLDLTGNRVTEIGALVLNQGLWQQDIMNLNDNPLSTISMTSFIPQLEQRGAIVLR
jgi:hypothetical protein